jgi:hypothetical protein
MKLYPLLAAAFLVSAAAADLPVKEVVLYKHGVGYFQRAGDLKPGEDARLDFKPAEMDDVLKSLLVQDVSGGKVAGLRYDSSEPLSQKLSTFPFRLGDNAPMSALLDTLKGARLDVNIGGQVLSGVIISARLAAATQQSPEKELLTLLLDSGDLRTLDLTSSTSLQLRDPELQQKLKEYLTLVNQSRSTEKRSVYIDWAGPGQRKIVANYVVPMPVWKSAYRLVFDSAATSTLEGWAIVDNITGEDWNDVRLSVVSGRPVSFISRLYEPRYAARPEAELPEERAQTPTLYGGVIPDEAKVAGQPEQALRAQRVPAAAGGLILARDSSRALAEASAPQTMAAPSTVAGAASAAELGELFAYNFPYGVSVRKGESAMLPFLQQRISARKLLIYSGAGEHPMNAAELANDTGKTLDGGPITVYDGGAYGGEALMETLKSNDKRLISYAVDLGTRITTQFGTTRNMVREIHFRRGILTSRQAMQETRTYTAYNADQKSKTLIIEHPARPEYQLTGLKPLEKTASTYRFEIKLPAGGSSSLAVDEERVYETTYSAGTMTPDALASYIQNKSLSETARKQLEALAEQKRRIADNDRAIAQAQQEYTSLNQDQTRLRQNIESLNRVSGQQDQVQQYARQLANQESRLMALRDRQAELAKLKADMEVELNVTIDKIAF